MFCCCCFCCFWRHCRALLFQITCFTFPNHVFLVPVFRGFFCKLTSPLVPLLSSRMLDGYWNKLRFRFRSTKEKTYCKFCSLLAGEMVKFVITMVIVLSTLTRGSVCSVSETMWHTAHSSFKSLADDAHSYLISLLGKNSVDTLLKVRRPDVSLMICTD